MRFHKPQLIPVLFILCAVSLCIALGLWQVQRLTWKQGLINSIQQSQKEPVLGTLPYGPEQESLAYRRVALTGHYLPEKALRFIGRQSNGYVHMVPLKLDDSDVVVLVDTGWLPAAQEAKITGEVRTVQGYLRPMRAKRMFSPENDPAKNLWFTEDLRTLEHATSLTLLPYVVESGDIRPLRNDHLGYAITWFALALVGIIMFGTYYRKKE